MRASRPILAAALVLATGLVTGCGRSATLRSNPTPELVTLYQRPVDVDNAMAIMSDENWRMFTQDLGRVFYTDRPSRLTREQVPR